VYMDDLNSGIPYVPESMVWWFRKGTHIPISKGQEIIILCAEHEIEFILNALLEWKAKTPQDDNHDQTNFGNGMNIN
jgi:hypothetical protein